MCYHNYTIHMGCNHLGVVHKTPYTLCDEATQRLLHLRGQPPQTPLTPFGPPKHRKTSISASKLGKRFPSLNSSFSRVSSHSSTSNRRPVFSPGSLYLSKVSTSSFAPGTQQIYDHEFKAVRCEQTERRTKVCSDMDVCSVCKGFIEQMRELVQSYDRTGSVLGSRGYATLLKHRVGVDGDEVAGL